MIGAAEEESEQEGCIATWGAREWGGSEHNRDRRGLPPKAQREQRWERKAGRHRDLRQSKIEGKEQ